MHHEHEIKVPPEEVRRAIYELVAHRARLSGQDVPPPMSGNGAAPRSRVEISERGLASVTWTTGVPEPPKSSRVWSLELGAISSEPEGKAEAVSGPWWAQPDPPMDPDVGEPDIAGWADAGDEVTDER